MLFKRYILNYKNLIQSNMKSLIILLLVFIITMIFYSQSSDLPKKLLVFLFIISSHLIMFLPKKIEVATVSIILTLGIFSATITPINDIPDETVHYARSFFLSEGNLNLSNDLENLQVSEDVSAIIDHNYQSILRIEDDIEHSNEKVAIKDINSTNGYYNFSYIPQSLGITIGNILNLEIIETYILGRVFNVLAYAGLVFIALSILVVGKQLFAVASLVPMNIYLSGSYNQDSVSLGLIFLISALFIKFLTDKNKISNKQIVIYTLLCSIVAFTKLPYILLIFLLLFIPSNRFNDSRKKIIIYKFLAIILVLTVTLFWLKTYRQIISPQIEVADFLQKVDVKNQFISIMSKPFTYGTLLLRHLLIHLFNPQGITVFGPLTYGMSELFSLNMIFYALTIFNNANELKISKWSKTGIFFIVMGIIGSIVLTFYLTYTPVGEVNVLGVQDRYFLGIIPLMFILLASNNKLFERCYKMLSDKFILNSSIFFIVIMIIRVLLNYYL
ncbi:DUF2142 domain-containing protein [Streptococcus sp. CSL10205-OR2]|nr:DUF2142 domain-containing protein [Streptococcus sp. CSL10205-OR2]